MAYEKVNGAWPATIPPLTPKEAISAAKRLYRKFMGQPFRQRVKYDPKMVGRSVDFAIDAGSRLYMRVNNRNGWHGLVHSMSHRVHAKLHRGESFKPHDYRHHWIEKEMVTYVVQQGWLDGKLKRPERPKAKADPLAKIAERVERWQRKKRRAENALRKLERRRRYYELKPAA